MARGCSLRHSRVAVNGRSVTPGRPKEVANNAYLEGIPFLEVLDRKMELRCLNCGGRDLRKVSLLYQEGRTHFRARTGLRGLLLGSYGPDAFVGRTNTVGILETQLSKNSEPPTKWSYAKLLCWFALASIVALVAYVHSVMSSPGMASSLHVAIYIVVASCLLLFLGLLFWRHNHLVFSRELALWERSFLCMRCGSVSLDPIENRLS